MRVNKIQHNKANLRMCQRAPPRIGTEGDDKDSMQELRFNQYGKYIQEKLGLFKKPNAYDLLLFNFEKEHTSSGGFELDLKAVQHKTTKSKGQIVSQRELCHTESPKRQFIQTAYNTKPIHLSGLRRKNFESNEKFSARKLLKTDIFSNDYDDYELLKQEYKANVVKRISNQRK